MAAEMFDVITNRIYTHASNQPDHAALVLEDEVLTYGGLNALMDRIAASLQRDGLRVGDPVAISADTSILYAAVFLGVLRAGGVVVPLPTSLTAASYQSMLADCQARWLFADTTVRDMADGTGPEVRRISLDTLSPGQSFDEWLVDGNTKPRQVSLSPDSPFNIIYSSGTTGAPKGIIQSHQMRWVHVMRVADSGYGTDAIMLIATPMYSNTTLIALFPTLAHGGTAVLTGKFTTIRYLELAERHKATHTMLVPVQYKRIMEEPMFSRFDLGSFRVKFCTSAPFAANLKTEILERWPGDLIETYGMTEGGGTCLLEAGKHPDKLHTVGRPLSGHDIRLIDDQENELPPGESGEIVGHSASMMTGYNGQIEMTRAVEWFDSTGKRFIRTGDIGTFDSDGYLILLGRKKDVIISGGFNIFPSDIESELLLHESVADAAVIGVPSNRWGETPVAFVVPQRGETIDVAKLLHWINNRVGKNQRLVDLCIIDKLPRSEIGKVLKKELRYTAVSAQSEKRSP